MSHIFTKNFPEHQDRNYIRLSGSLFCTFKNIVADLFCAFTINCTRPTRPKRKWTVTHRLHHDMHQGTETEPPMIWWKVIFERRTSKIVPMCFALIIGYTWKQYNHCYSTNLLHRSASFFWRLQIAFRRKWKLIFRAGKSWFGKPALSHLENLRVWQKLESATYVSITFLLGSQITPSHCSFSNFYGILLLCNYKWQ